MLQRIVRATVGLGLIAALAGCPSTNPPPPPPPASVTPTGFTVQGFGPYELVLSWEPLSAVFDGYRLEVADGTGPFQQIGTDLIPATYRAVQLRSQSGIPEAVHLHFALTAIRQGQAIGPAALADFVEPLLSVDSLRTLLVDGGFLVSWSSSSKRAELAEIVRARLELADAGPPDPGFPIQQPVSVTSYFDENVSEGSNYLYTVTLRGASTVSVPSSVEAQVPLLSPTELLVIGRAGGVDLQWKSPSPSATELVVGRNEGFTNGYFELVHLPADAGGYRDVPPSPGVYTYTLLAQRPGSLPGWTQDAGVAPPRGDLLFDAALLPGPIGSTAVRDGRGVWTVCGGPDGVADLTGERPAFLPQGLSYWVAPCLLLDPGGVPHAVYGTATANPSSETLWHAWFDGTSWQTEEIATRSAGFGYPVFALDAAGRPHVVWEQWGMNPDQGFEYAHRSTGGWAVEAPALPLDTSEYIWDLQVDGSGTTHVLMAPQLDLLERASAGAWSRGLIPIGTGQATAPPYGQLRLRGGADLTVIFVRSGIEIATRRAGTWSAPEVVAPHLMTAALPLFVAAVSRDGTRLALGFESSDEQTLLIQAPAGSRHGILGGTEPYVAGLAFDPDGGVHGLQYLSNILPGRPDWLDYGTFDEVPAGP